jgi:hypothetical protein
MCRAVIASPPVARRWLQVACPLRSWRLRGSGEVCPFGAPSPCAPTGGLHSTGTLPHGVISDVNITPASHVSVAAMPVTVSRLQGPGHHRQQVTTWSWKLTDLASLPTRGELVARMSDSGILFGQLAGQRGKDALDLAPDVTHRYAKDALAALHQVDDLLS